MEFTAQLDVDVTAPVPEEIADRPVEGLIAVVDRY